MIFMGTDKSSWVHNHAYTLLWAKDINIDGENQQWVKVRNPWGS